MNTSPPGCGFPQALNSYVWVIMNNSKQQSIFKAPPTSPPVCGGGGGGWMMWPPRSYPCNFCKRDFRSAQALGGHMNVHRRDRALLKQEDHLLRHTTTLNPSHHEDHHHHLNSTIGGHHVSTHRHLNPSLANKSTTVCNSSKKGGICHALAARTRVLTGSSSRQMGFVSSSKCNSTTSSCSPTLRNYRRLSKLSCGCKGSEIVHQTKLSNKGFISCTPWKLIKGGGNDAAAAFNTKRHKKNQGGFNDLVSSSWPPLDSNKGSCNSVTKCVTTLHEPEDNLLDLELRLGDRGTNN